MALNPVWDLLQLALRTTLSRYGQNQPF